MRNSLSNVGENLRNLVGQSSAPPTSIENTQSGARAMPATQVELRPQELNTAQLIAYPGIVSKNDTLVLSRNTMLTITLTYEINLTQKALKVLKATEHNIIFILVPEGNLTCSIITLLDAFRDQIYSKLRRLQQKGVIYKRIEVKIQEISSPVMDLSGFAVSTVKVEPIAKIGLGIINFFNYIFFIFLNFFFNFRIN